MNTWKLTYNKFDSEMEGLREALCTLGNGYFGVRGADCEASATKVHYPGTYIAGVYNTLATEVAGRKIYNEDFVNCPNGMMLNYRIDDDPWFDRLNIKVLTWKKELDMKRGMLSRRVRWQDSRGRITLFEDHRIVSMAHPHCGASRCTITPENYSGTITVRSGIDGLVINAGVDRYKQLLSKHLEPCAHDNFGKDGIYLQMKTNQSKIQITQAQRTLVYKGHERVSVPLKVVRHGQQRIFHELKIEVKEKERVSVEKLLSVYTSRDQGVADDCQRAQERVGQIKNFEDLFQAHKVKWKSLWKRYDIEVKGDDFTQLTLRLHAFHLLQSASTYNEDIDAGMPVRGLHGEAYRGHIFWDELYVFPFYNLRSPETTRALLMYRYRRLGAAKDYAKQNNVRGAMYPWQTASTGEEVTQVVHLNPLSNTWGPDHSALQRHVSIAVAYNVWTYFHTTADRDFLDRYGAEMILEIALMWSSMATFNKKTKRFEIDGVMGPDEFHEMLPGAEKGGLKNNAYTNVMVVWVLQKALYIIDQLLEPEDSQMLLIKAGIKEEDIERWRQMTTNMTIPMDEKGLIHQFEGYMDLEELNWDEYRQKYSNIHRIDRILKAEGSSPDQYKVAKQADVLMIFFVLNLEEVKEIFSQNGYSFTKKIIKKNFDYYVKRTSHGSTLSKVVHAYVAELIGYHDLAREFFKDALKSDIYDTQGGTTQEGIHAGVMGSTIDLFLRSFGGLHIYEDRISLEPQLPEGWESIKFRIRHKNVWFHIEIRKDEAIITPKLLDDMSLQPNIKIPIEIKKKTHHLVPNKPHRVSNRHLFMF